MPRLLGDALEPAEQLLQKPAEEQLINVHVHSNPRHPTEVSESVPILEDLTLQSQEGNPKMTQGEREKSSLFQGLEETSRCHPAEALPYPQAALCPEGSGQDRGAVMGPVPRSQEGAGLGMGRHADSREVNPPPVPKRNVTTAKTRGCSHTGLDFRDQAPPEVWIPEESKISWQTGPQSRGQSLASNCGQLGHLGETVGPRDTLTTGTGPGGVKLLQDAVLRVQPTDASLSATSPNSGHLVLDPCGPK
ncbi:hypothetical protein H920_02642 [Fukomys damarensis]|uniref:Uncharacterized protein n=1 Tax=Fukomys damarensis TaxID=885580 RepID=A0A091EK77_FUKDA|nr:hypothetical protein H920_02642 [Fukomys damarensis]